MILFPLAIDNDGDLLHSNDPLDLLASEAYSFLDTELYTRPLRISYGSKAYVLSALDLGALLADLTIALLTNLPSGFGQISVSSNSTAADLQSGIVNISIEYSYDGSFDTLNLSLSLQELANSKYLDI